MVTKFAATHGVESLAKDFAQLHAAGDGPQYTHYSVGGRLPGERQGRGQIKDPYIKGFALSGSRGIPMPNIPEMNSVWTDLGQAWVRSTKGAGAMPAQEVVHRRAAVDRSEDRLADAERECGCRDGTRTLA